MWQEMTLSLPESPAPIVCREMAIHPWDPEHGNSTPDGNYLSPVNALTALAGKMGNTLTGDIIIIMVCASDATDFSGRLNTLAGVIPLPAVSQAYRRAKAQITQATARMQIPSTPLSGLSSPAPLMINTLNAAISNNRIKQAMKAAATGDMNAVKSALAAFQEQRRQIQQQITREAPARTAKVFAFIHDAGSPLPPAMAIMKNIPRPASSLTYVHMFTGDLAGMKTWFKGAQ